MAIFVIDQFSLNTDLPLDIRYVPAGGRFDPDISIFKYPGMQVYDTTTQSVWFADNSLNWNAVGSDDASLADVYSFLNDLSTLISDHDASIKNLYNITSGLDASIVRIDSSLNSYGLLLQIHDTSIGNLAIRVASLETSVGYLTTWNSSQDASITSIKNIISSIDASIIRIDASLNAYGNLLQIHDTSIGLIITDVSGILDYQAIQDVSILGIDASITALQLKDAQIDASITALQLKDIQIDASIARIDASLGDYVKKSGDIMTGPLTITEGGLQVGTIGNPFDVSIYSRLYVHDGAVIGGDLTIDGSLFVRSVESIDVSAGFIFLNTGQTGTPPASMQSGIIIDRGSLEPYVFIFDESTQAFRIGIAAPDGLYNFDDASTQAVATREDTPTANGVAYWNGTQYRFDTNSKFTFDSSTLLIDSSLTLGQLADSTDLMLVVQPSGNVAAYPIPDISTLNTSILAYIDGSLSSRDASLNILFIKDTQIDASITALQLKDTQIDASIVRIDASITNLYSLIVDPSVKGAINIGDGSTSIYAGLSVDGSLQFKTISGVGPITLNQDNSIISIGIDGSFGQDYTINIGDGEGLALPKTGSELPFKTISTLDPSSVIITSDNSTLYIDVSIVTVTSLVGLTDTSINIGNYKTHQNIEYDASVGKWINTDNIWWDSSLATTTDDLGGITQGTNLQGLTLKEILYKILYEYQIPTLSITASPTGGIYEKGLVTTQFSSIDINWEAANTNYPLAKLSLLNISKTSAGTLLNTSLGLVDSSSGLYTDSTGITNWGGSNRTITYTASISDDQVGQTQPAVAKQTAFTFYYRQFWGTVDGNTIANQVNSAMILGLDDSRLSGETDLMATFTNPGTGFVKYLFAYPDTIAAPDNFGLLSGIIDQNDFDSIDTFLTENEDVSIGDNNIRYRFYLSKNKVNNSTFNVTFKF